MEDIKRNSQRDNVWLITSGCFRFNNTDEIDQLFLDKFIYESSLDVQEIFSDLDQLINV